MAKKMLPSTMDERTPFIFLPPSFEGLIGVYLGKVRLRVRRMDDLTPFKWWCGWIVLLPVFEGSAGIWMSVWSFLSLATAGFLARAIKE